MEGIKIRVEISVIENRKTVEKNKLMNPKTGFLEKSKKK